MEDNPGWFAHPAFENWAKPFEQKYQMIDMLMIGDPSFAKSKTRKKTGRHCIFCNKSYPDTDFKNASHLLPRMIGNTDLYSTFECDACNNKFSLLETDLAYFLGLGRSITGISENKKTPGFAGINMEAKSFIFRGKKVLVIHKESALRNTAEGSTKLNYHKPTYTPANVYKLFLKCALSILPKKEVIRDYSPALKHLQGRTVLTGALINIFRFPLTVKMPLHVYIFKKKSMAFKLPTYVISFYFDNLVITLPVLLHRGDLQHINEKIELPFPPPYFIHGNDLIAIIPSFARFDFSLPYKLKSEPEEIIMQFDKSDLANASRFDPETGELTQTIYDPADSKYIIVTEMGIQFSKEELTELLKKINQEFSN